MGVRGGNTALPVLLVAHVKYPLFQCLHTSPTISPHVGSRHSSMAASKQLQGEHLQGYSNRDVPIGLGSPCCVLLTSPLTPVLVQIQIQLHPLDLSCIIDFYINMFQVAKLYPSSAASAQNYDSLLPSNQTTVSAITNSGSSMVGMIRDKSLCLLSLVPSSWEG